MAERMTLEQIVHLLRNASEDAVNPRYRKKFKEAADALEVNHLTQPAQEVDVGAILEVVFWLTSNSQWITGAYEQGQKLTRAIGNKG